MKKWKQTPSLPRRTWTINPVTRVKLSARAYSRQRTQAERGKQRNEE